jgi:hypothetical protein
MRFGIAKAGSLLVGGIALTTTLGFSAAGAANATVSPNATAACGTNCYNISSRILGPNTLLNAYVPGDTGTGAKAGQVINMKQGSNASPNEDFVLDRIGTVASQCRSFFNPDGILLSNSVLCQAANGFRNKPAYEVNFAPFGNETGLCAGTTGTPVSGLQVRLTGCGTTEGTLVVQGSPTTVGTPAVTYHTYISGATSTFSHPYVFTVNTGTSSPQNLIQLQQENLLTGSTPASNQLFLATPSPAGGF